MSKIIGFLYLSLDKCVYLCIIVSYMYLTLVTKQHKKTKILNIMTKRLQFKMKLIPDTRGTLEAMKKGDVIFISTKDAKTSSIRVAASRIKNMLFEVTEKGLVNETKVTRLK